MPAPTLLLYNSPRVRRYFLAVREALGHEEIRVAYVGVSGRGVGPDTATLDWIVDFGLRRKRARAHYGPARLAFFEALYRRAAVFHYRGARQHIETERPRAIGVWGGEGVDTRAAVAAAREAGIGCFRFENGFLPATTQVDPRGVNAGGSLPRQAEFYEQWAALHPETGPLALPQRLVPRQTRQSVRRAAIPLPERYLFAPFQVKLDSQMLLHGDWITGMPHFVEVLLEAREALGPEAPALVFKRHPSCPETWAALREAAIGRPGVHFADGNSTEELVRGSLGVITVNSTVGVEALLLERPVLALGDAVYAIPHVAERAHSVEDTGRWMAALQAGTPPSAPQRESFLRFLAQVHLIPGDHRHPGPDHMAALRQRLTEGYDPAALLA